MTLVVNLFGGPGTGKSTTAAGVFYELKQRGLNAELVTEYAKDVVWGQNFRTLDDQLYIFAKQHHRLWRVQGQVDVVVTDCPLFLSMYYGEKMSRAFHDLVYETFMRFNNLNVFLGRVKPYNPAGRVQNETKARQIDVELKALLTQHSVDHVFVAADSSAAETVATMATRELERRAG